jgi:hypothetical protein
MAYESDAYIVDLSLARFLATNPISKQENDAPSEEITRLASTLYKYVLELHPKHH